MLETLLAKSRPYFPNSGPGNKYLLAGNSTIGYLGALTSSEFGSLAGAGIADYLQLTNYAENPNNVWHKFIYKGKFLFIPDSPIAYGISQKDIFEFGALSGVDVEVHHAGGEIAITQDARVYWHDAVDDRRYGYRLRNMISNASEKTTDAQNNAAGGTSTAYSEYIDLWVKFKTNLYAGRWWGIQSMGSGVTFVGEDRFTLAEQTIEAGAVFGTSNTTTVTEPLRSGEFDLGVGYRPVLELLPAGPEYVSFVPNLTANREVIAPAETYVDPDSLLKKPFITFPDSGIIPSTPAVDGDSSSPQVKAMLTGQDSLYIDFKVEL